MSAHSGQLLRCDLNDPKFDFVCYSRKLRVNYSASKLRFFVGVCFSLATGLSKYIDQNFRDRTRETLIGKAYANVNQQMEGVEVVRSGTLVRSMT